MASVRSSPPISTTAIPHQTAATSAPHPPSSVADTSAGSPNTHPGSSPGPLPSLTKHYLSPQIELTGARAVADDQIQQRQTARQSLPMTSPNPALSPFLLSTTISPPQPMSRPSDAPPSVSSLHTRPPHSAGYLGSAISGAPNDPPGSNNIDMDRNGASMNRVNSPATTPYEATQSGQSNSYHQNMYPPTAPSTLHPNVFASPQRQTQEPARMSSRKASAEKSRKRRLSPSSQEGSPNYSSYPPITPASDRTQGAANRAGSLPNSANRTGGKSPATKKHRCPHCSTEFTRHHNLKSHLLTHSQEKPFGCSTCDARFRRLHDLKRHLKAHTGERPHACEVCGRAFARGDALARHNKGPGGCAGRRESGVDEDDLDGDVDMDAETQGTGQEAANVTRRKSEPNKRPRRSSNRFGLTSVHQPQTHGSTYPPVAPMTAAPQPYYSTAATGNTTSSSRPRGMSPPQHHYPSMGGLFSSVYYNQNPSVYAQSGVTESPKPLSPGQPDLHRGSEASTHGRSPGVSTRMQPSMLRSNKNPGTPPVGLPPPHQQLPSMQTTDSRSLPSGGARLPPPGISTHIPQPSGPHSGPPSAGPASAASSHLHSSGGSLRELYGPASGTNSNHETSAQIEALEAYVHELKNINQEERQKTAREKEENARLRDELGLLKAQVGAGRR